MLNKFLLWFKKQYRNIYYCSACDVKLKRINSYLDAFFSLKYKYKCPNCGIEKSIRAR